jgi:hypothetical protein
MDYFNPDVPVKATGAMVTLSDNRGEHELLEEIDDGVYVAKSINGISGTAYDLKIEYDNITYESTAFLPQAVSIDSLGFEYFSFGGRADTSGYLVNISFTDPVNISNYYKINYSKIISDSSGKEQISRLSYQVISDAFNDGLKIRTVVNRDQLLQLGDTVLVELISVDENVYRYFNQLTEYSGMGPMTGSSSPANPDNNISNNAMGYFSAEAIDRKIIKIK